MYQPRKPAGAANSTGGQFAEKHRDEVGAELLEEPYKEELVYRPCYDIPVSHLPDFEKTLASTNRRLERAGLPEDQRFTIDVSEFITEKGESGMMEHRVMITLNRPSIKYGDYQFLARVEPVGDKFVAYSAPGKELDGWRPESMECEHCHQKRHRTKMYVVENSAGERKTVGGNCVEAYTGMSPKGLRVLERSDMERWLNEHHGSPGGRLDSSARSENVVAISKVIVDKYGYVGRNNPDAKSTTASRVKEVLWPVTEAHWRVSKDIRAEAAKLDGEKLKAEIAEALEDQHNDWAKNVKAFMQKDTLVNSRALGTVVSSVLALKKQEPKKPKWTPGFVAPPGEKIKDLPCTVTKIEHREEAYGYYPKTVQLITMRTADGKKVFWKNSGEHQKVEAGDSVSITRATVKDNDHWTPRDNPDAGVDSTRIVRAKLKQATN